LLCLRAARRGSVFGEDFLEAVGAEGLAAPPRTRITDDLFHAVVDGDGTGIGFDDEAAANIALMDTVTVAIKRQAKIFVDERFSCVAVVVRDDR
jgi:hypothetical protein